MDGQMLQATREAAWAAQSAGEAAWWGLAANGALTLLTLTTLMATLRIASHGNIDRRNRDAALLRGLQTILAKASSTGRTIDVANKERLAVGFRSTTKVLDDSRLIEKYEAVDVRDVATAEAVAAYLDGQIALKQLRFHMQLIADGDTGNAAVANLEIPRANVVACAKRLGDEANILLKKSLFERLLGH